MRCSPRGDCLASGGLCFLGGNDPPQTPLIMGGCAPSGRRSPPDPPCLWGGSPPPHASLPLAAWRRPGGGRRTGGVLFGLTLGSVKASLQTQLRLLELADLDAELA